MEKMRRRTISRFGKNVSKLPAATAHFCWRFTFGLNPDEKRQLFHDLNRLGKKVDTNLALQFDNSNPINLFIKDRLIQDLGIGVSETDVKDWDDDEGKLPRRRYGGCERHSVP